MKNIFSYIFCLVLFIHQAYGVGAVRINTSSITFYNFSQSTYDLADHVISINNSFINVNTLNVQNGNMMVPAGGDVTLEGLSIPISKGSYALWAPGTTTANASVSNIIDFAQWGAASQPYEGIAEAVFLWTLGTFIDVPMPFLRDPDFNFRGANRWSSQATSVDDALTNQHIRFTTYPNPFTSELTISAKNTDSYIIKLFDVQGRLLQQTRSTGNREEVLPTSHLGSGVYYLSIISSNGIIRHTQKMMKP